MSLLELPILAPPRGRHSLEPRRPSWAQVERRVVVGLLAVAYAAIGFVLVLRYGSVSIDALARVANASFVLDSRDPHLSAIGFVWNPLPSLLAVPFVPLKAWWPALISRGLIGNALSALTMALAVGVFHALLEDLATPRRRRLLLTLLLGLNPMVVFYGANGMSEAYLLLTLMWATRSLVAWLRFSRTSSLVSCGLALAVAYLARYEAVAPAVAVGLLVLVVTWRREPGTHTERFRAARADAMLVTLPFGVCFVAWAAVSWIVVGAPFQTLSSTYGNSAQVADKLGSIQAVTGHDLTQRSAYLGEQLLALAPLLALVLLVALWQARRVQKRWLLAPVAAFGGVLAFQSLAFLAGGTFGWLRFSLTAIPLAALLAAGLASPVLGPRRRWRLLAVGVLVSSAVGSGWAMTSTRLAREESSQLAAVGDRADASAGQRDALHRFISERRIAHYLDGMHLPNGSVLLDTGAAFATVLESDDPKQFVITSDLDFRAVLADPSVYGVHYVVVSDNYLDVVNRTYPGGREGSFPNGELVLHLRPVGGPTSYWVYHLA